MQPLMWQCRESSKWQKSTYYSEPIKVFGARGQRQTNHPTQETGLLKLHNSPAVFTRQPCFIFPSFLCFPNLNKLLTSPPNKDRSCAGWHHRGLHLNLFVLCRNPLRVYSIYKTLCPTRFLQTAALDHLWRRKNGQHPDIIYLGRHVKCLNMKLCTRQSCVCYLTLEVYLKAIVVWKVIGLSLSFYIIQDFLFPLKNHIACSSQQPLSVKCSRSYKFLSSFICFTIVTS